MIKKIFGLILSVCILVSSVECVSLADDVKLTQMTEDTRISENSDFYYVDYDTYSEYLSQTSAKDANDMITLSADSYDLTSSENVRVETIDDVQTIVTSENGKLTIPLTVEEEGYYNIVLDYYPISAGTSSIKFELLIDGQLPFEEAQSFSLKRIWKDDKKKEYDSQGNQIRLPSVETPVWTQKTLTDSSGFADEPLRFYFDKGAHEITFSVYQNELALSQIRLMSPEELPSYRDVLTSYESGDYQKATETQRVEAEEAVAKSDRSIVLVNDKTSPVTVPYSGREIVYNTIGGGNWKTVGEWVEWEIDAPENGMYSIVVRFKQDIKSSDVSFRTLYIDGKIPFTEARTLSFPYSGNWQTRALGNDDGAYQFYLEKGKHTIRLEATLGNYNNMIATVGDTLTELNEIYTDIVMITGTEPDIDRDYQLEKMIPDVLVQMEETSDKLKKIEKQIEILTGERGGESAAAVVRLYKELDKMLEDTDSIAKRLKNYMSDITSLGTWLNTSREQPLQLDYIMLSNENVGTPKDRANIFSIIKYYVTQFLYSFKMDYINVGNKDIDAEKEITVWISSGRDQADIIRQLVNESFTAEHGIGVNVQLVDAGALMPATLSNEGPDVYLGMTQTQPVEYALRHAVVDLAEFEDSDEVLTRFYQDSLTSFQLDDGIYALPETMSYPMLFYRKDILTELGIKEEDLLTWDSLLQTVLPELDMNNFDFGLPASINTFGNFLYQNGGSFYNEKNTASEFNSAQAIKAFKIMTTMYTDYGVPLSYDFANRFRSGQMPLAVAEYTSYNQLSIFAPEIEGMWGMLPLPGTVDENQNIDKTAVCTVTGAVILSTSSCQEESWTFLKWWTSDEVQSRYASELETVMGTGARYASANIEAMRSVEWERDIKMSLTKQQECLQGIPSIAGGYYTTRSYDFAFRDVVYNGENLREVLADTATTITKEIKEKRSEFYDEE